MALRHILIFCLRLCGEPCYRDNNKEILTIKKKRKEKEGKERKEGKKTHMKGNMFPISSGIIFPAIAPLQIQQEFKSKSPFPVKRDTVLNFGGFFVHSNLLVDDRYFIQQLSRDYLLTKKRKYLQFQDFC